MSWTSERAMMIMESARPPFLPPSLLYLKLRRPHIHDIVRYTPHSLDSPQEILVHLLHAHCDSAALDPADFHLGKERGRNGSVRYEQ